MIIEIGHFAVIMALVLSFVGIAAPIIGLKSKNGASGGTWVAIGRQAVTMIFVLLGIGMAAMIYAYLTQDYSVKYVMATSNSRLPIFYKIAGLWGGHEGSLLLWVFILSLFCTIAVWAHWRSQPALIPYLISVESLIQCGFLLLIVFLSNPFERLYPAAPDGKDLNPLLQDPAMVLHPPFLYLGYVAFSIPFAFAMAALFSGRLGQEWITVVRRWTISAWLFLTVGIMMGGYWAYYELGWGGYWGWDPVENASFMPWLVGTAFLHSIMVQQARKMFQVWNLFLIILAFSFSLIGTFLVRSGILSSVHTFATDPGRGLFILLFLAFMLLLSFGTLILRSNKLKSQVELDSLVSREAAFLFNNLFFIAALATVFLGTLYPLFVEATQFKKVSVGPPYYNAVFLPIAMGIVLLMGIGPYIPWRKASLQNLKEIFLPPVLLALGGIPILLLLGIRNLYALAGAAVVLFTGGAIGFDFAKVSAFWAGRKKVGYLKGLSTAFSKNPRRYAGILTHIGVLITVVGIIGSTIYQQEKVVQMKPGESVQVKGYSIKLLRLYGVEGRNWIAQEGLFNVYSGDRLITQLRPQKRLYTVAQTPTTEAAYSTVNLGHIFLTVPEVAPDMSSATVRALVNPLVLLVWIGGGIMGMGVLLNLFWPKRRGAVAIEPSAIPADIAAPFPAPLALPREGVRLREKSR